MNKIEDVLSWDNITREKFFNVLEEEAKLICLQDIMQASLFLVYSAHLGKLKCLDAIKFI